MSVYVYKCIRDKVRLLECVLFNLRRKKKLETQIKISLHFHK